MADKKEILKKIVGGAKNGVQTMKEGIAKSRLMDKVNRRVGKAQRYTGSDNDVNNYRHVTAGIAPLSTRSPIDTVEDNAADTGQSNYVKNRFGTKWPKKK